ncbi:MAG: LamG domain-containing protein [Actinomycetales bacterium]
MSTRHTRAGGGFLAVLALVGCTPQAEPTASTTQPSSEPAIRMERVLEYDFTASGPLSEGAPVVDTGTYSLDGVVRLSGTKPMALEPVPGPDPGSVALQFPVSCTSQIDSECPKAIIEVPDSPMLNPGARPFSWGATVMMTPVETSTGSNIMQKGFSTGGKSQWKLQVDNKEGQPSCLVVGTMSEEKFEALSDISVADGQWHELRCQRTRQSLRLLVDDVEHAVVDLPSGLVIDPPTAMRIGGKNVKHDNDQYFGAMNSVFVDVAAS